MSGTSVHPAVAVILLTCVLGLFAFAWIRFFNFVIFKLSGWKRLHEQFPPNEKPEVGRVYSCQSGNAGKCRCNRVFQVEVSRQGLLVTPSFATRLPILIPWSKIRDVSAAEGKFGGISLGIDFETPTRFDLPTESLSGIREKISPDRFHKATSYFDFVAQKLKGESKPES